MTNVGRSRAKARTGQTVVHRKARVFPGELRRDGEKFGAFPSGSPQGIACMLVPMGGVAIGSVA